MLKYVKVILKSVREYTLPSILTIGCMIFEVGFETAIPFIMSILVDKMNEIRGMGDLSSIWIYAIALIGLAVLSLLSGFGGGFFGAKASTGFAKNLRKDMYDNIQTFSFANIDKFSQASLITRMTSDITRIQNLYQMMIRIVIRAPLMFIFSIIMGFITGGKMAFIFVVVIPIIVCGLGLIFKFAKPIFDRVFKKYDRMNESVQENVKGIRVVKSYVREEYEKAKFKKASDDVTNDFVKAEKFMAFSNPIMSLAMYTVLFLITGIGSYVIIESQEALLTIGKMQALLAYGMQCLMNLSMLSMIFVMLTINSVCVKRIGEVLVEKQTITNPINPIMEVKNGDIVFDHVSFKYSQEAKEYSLQDINLKIRSGEVIGVIGSTGSGKTSLINLISRLYDVSEGVVKVGGVDVRNYDLKVLRDAVSVVLQKNELFSGTIVTNLQWGKEDASLDEIKHVCQIAQAEEFILQFEGGYDYKIEQGGTNVSGGQKQRLCIARALLKNPKILVLDDSTSAVDTKTDALIRNALANEMPQTTKIIIAQRISSIQNADKIIVLDNGKVDSFGTHDELLKNNKIYQQVYYTQNKKGGK